MPGLAGRAIFRCLQTNNPPTLGTLVDWKLLASTFGLIFLAELGDKTQLAAFAASAGAKSPWSVFAGAAFALVLSTLLAVLLGDTVQRFVPQSYLKMGAGILFLVFGGLLIASVFARPAEARPAAAPLRADGLSRLVLSMAKDFEEAAATGYLAMAREAQDPALRALLETLAAEEQEHLRAVNDTLHSHGTEQWTAHNVIAVAPLNPQVSAINDSSLKLLDQAIAHEHAKAGFYATLADSVPLASLRSAFAALAEDERRHARRLEDFARSTARHR
jgi:Ca2+/H+ antiporter, TMEM165/GDT1 family